MLMFNWWIGVEWTAALAMILLAIFVPRFARKLPSLTLRIMAWAVAMPLGLVGGLLALLLLSFSGCHSHSAPIYSPSGTMAVRIENADMGAVGGQTLVDLYWAQGLRRKTIFSGPIGSVEPVDIHWESNLKLTIHYAGNFSGDYYHCVTQTVISIDCSPRLR